MGKKREFVGTVISDKMQKTIIVKIMRLTKHPKYKRIIKKYNKFKVHDEKGIAKIGDMVRIQQTRPISKEKHFRLLEVIKPAKSSGIEIKPELL
ncbi:MAG: 30S ribosomal protein S17 [Candidatus Omnitrophica bacterium]|nr:30S ribosomal protein S17 [Candidatus Omnitrophota bacterium]